MLGVDTIGNSTLIAYDATPVIATDPLMGKPAYFRSEGGPFDIPEEQQRVSLDPNMFGYRTDIRDDRTERKFDVTVLKSGEWIPLSNNIRVYCISDYSTMQY